MNFIVKKPFSANIARIPSFFTNTKNLTEVICIDLVECASIIGIFCTPSVIVVKNCNMGLP
jgi:hypothetical protein